MMHTAVTAMALICRKLNPFSAAVFVGILFASLYASAAEFPTCARANIVVGGLRLDNLTAGKLRSRYWGHWRVIRMDDEYSIDTDKPLRSKARYISATLADQTVSRSSRVTRLFFLYDSRRRATEVGPQLQLLKERYGPWCSERPNVFSGLQQYHWIDQSGSELVYSRSWDTEYVWIRPYHPMLGK